MREEWCKLRKAEGEESGVEWLKKCKGESENERGAERESESSGVICN